MKYKVKHFKLQEFSCPCCGRPRVAVALVFWLDVLRRVLVQPLKINSGFRCASRNSEVGGSATSRHLIGCAADVAKPLKLDYQSFIDAIRSLSGDGWEIVEYPARTYVHVAVPRDSIKMWDGEGELTL
jgi:uncharacterized protein YcbK (DUF882 family)